MLSPFHLNDWEFKRFATVCLSLLFALLILVVLSPWSVYVMLARYLVGIAYCLIIPGALILRVFRIHKLPAIESLSLTVGLSIAFVMFAGFVINLTLPQAGLLTPLSTTPVLVTFTISTLFLLLVCYFRDRDFSNPARIDVSENISAPLLALCLVPFLSVFGTYAMNYYNNNWLLLVLLLIVPFIVFYMCFFKPSNKFHPVAVFVISIALLYHVSLMTSHLVGFDIQYESYVSKVVLENAYWNSALLSSAYNTALSITMLAPILSLLSGLDLTAVYKVIYPLLYSLVPLGLYEIYRRQTNERTAFFSVVFFMSSYTFFVLVPGFAKQSIGEIFVVMFMLLIFNVKIGKEKKAALLIISVLSIAVSHYGVAYLFGLLLLTGLLGEYITTIRAWRSAKNRGHEPEREAPALSSKNDNHSYPRRKIPNIVGLLYLLGILVYYLFFTNGRPFETLVSTVRLISENLGQAFNPSVAEGASILVAQQSSLLHETTRYLNIISQAAIILGLVVCILKINKKRIDATYVYFSMGAFVLLVAAFALPYLGAALNTIRIYHFALIFLSVFVVIGWKGVVDVMRLARPNVRPEYTAIWIKSFSVFLIALLLFNSGLIYEIAHDNPQSFSLNASVVTTVFSDGDVRSATWIAQTGEPSVIFTDGASRQLLMGFGLPTYSVTSAGWVPTYVFYGHFNKGENKAQALNETRVNITANTLPDYVLPASYYRIYDNGDSQIYRSAQRTYLSLSVTNATPAVNQSVTFTATLTSGTTPLSQKPVTIYHYLNGVRNNDTIKTTDANGQITLTQSFGSAAQRPYYATFAGDISYQNSTSSVLTINVR